MMIVVHYDGGTIYLCLLVKSYILQMAQPKTCEEEDYMGIQALRKSFGIYEHFVDGYLITSGNLCTHPCNT